MPGRSPSKVPGSGPRVVALDGKTLRRSFDHLNDRAAAHVLGAFACDAALILAHQEVRDAPDEVPAVRALIEALDTEPVRIGLQRIAERRPAKALAALDERLLRLPGL